MKVSLTHEIENKSETIFRDAIPAKWTYNVHRKDYGKDYYVEPSDDQGQLTGKNFWVQLKGTTRPKKSKHQTAIAFSLKKKYAEYYLDKLTQEPVFLVLVDVTRKSSWFVFLQPILAANEEWRQRGSLTVYVPLTNELKLANADSLLSEVAKAREWLRRRNPFAVQDAIAVEKDRIRLIEPRCDVSISHIDGITSYTMRPREPIRIQARITGHADIVGPKIKRFARGEEVVFAPGELTVEGSALFKNFPETGGTIQAV